MKRNIDKKHIKILMRIVLIAGIAACVVFAAVNLIDYIDGLVEADRLKNLSQAEQRDIVPNPSSTVATEDADTVPAAPAEFEKPKQLLAKYEKLLKLNDEVSGWIKIDGTRVDYPFLRHSDNEYYLHMDIENKKSKRGCVAIDYRNNRELTDKNTLVYAHNMKDGSMFKDIVQYKNKDFFYAHDIIHMDNLYEQIDWQVFSVYVVDADKETINIDYSDEDSFLKEMNSFKDRSIYKTDVELSSEDSIITLVTCSYETSNSRTIVHAKRLSR